MKRKGWRRNLGPVVKGLECHTQASCPSSFPYNVEILQWPGEERQGHICPVKRLPQLLCGAGRSLGPQSRKEVMKTEPGWWV